jgi:hypothetical protein
MAMNVALTTLKGVGFNSLYAAGHFAGGYAITYAVYEVGHFVLRAQIGSRLSQKIEFVAACIGVAASVYLAPQAALVNLAAKQVLAAIAISVAVAAAISYSNVKILQPIVLVGGVAIAGAATASLGTHLLPIWGGIGALIAIVD